MVFIYYYFSVNVNPEKVYQSMSHPVVLSIATLRSTNKERIVVIDVSEHENDWGIFPELLNFEVVKQDASMKDEKIALGDFIIYENMLSKTIDVNKFIYTLDEIDVVVVDSDIFFIQSPIPFHRDPKDGMCCGENAGYYYFHNNKKNRRTMNMWSAMCWLAAKDSLFQQRILKFSHSPKTIHEELVWNYMRRNHPRCVCDIPYIENCSLPHYKICNNPEEVKALHHCCEPRMERGWFCMKNKEVRDRICVALNEENIKLIFGDSIHQEDS